MLPVGVKTAQDGMICLGYGRRTRAPASIGDWELKWASILTLFPAINIIVIATVAHDPSTYSSGLTSVKNFDCLLTRLDVELLCIGVVFGPDFPFQQ